jgi:hypothetical protein
MVSIWTAADTNTWTRTRNKVRQRFTFPSPNKKGLQPLKYCANFSKNPISDLLTTVWQEKPGRLEEKILDKTGQE